MYMYMLDKWFPLMARGRRPAAHGVARRVGRRLLAPVGIHQRGVQWEWGAVDWGRIT